MDRLTVMMIVLAALAAGCTDVSDGEAVADHWYDGALCVPENPVAGFACVDGALVPDMKVTPRDEQVPDEILEIFRLRLPAATPAPTDHWYDNYPCTPEKREPAFDCVDGTLVPNFKLDPVEKQIPPELLEKLVRDFRANSE
jgi:hypothetical protein